MLVGLALWGAAVVGVAQHAEELCFDDLDGRAGYGAYRAESELWPPSHRCRLLSNDFEPVTVQHRGVALARFGALAVFPVAYSGFVGMVVLGRRRDVGSPSTARPQG